MSRSWRAGVCAIGCGLLAIVGSTACDEKLSDLTGPSPNLTVSFASIRAEIIDTTDSAGRSACVSCHNPQGRTPMNLQADPYAALVNVQSRGRPGETLVIPGNPNDSYLIRKLEGRNITGVRMPFSGPPYLTDGQIRVIRRWIEIGAPNN